MSPSNKQISNKRVLASPIPEGVAPKTSHFRTVTVTEDVPILKTNEIFIKNLIFSLDPYIRFDFTKNPQESKVIGFGIAQVLDSTHDQFPINSLVIAPSNWEEYTLLSDPELLKTVTRFDHVRHPDIPLSAYNGVMGMFGYTVWDSLDKIGDLKKGETLYVSSAAGTLGQLVGQLAKRKGLTVIGSAGTPEKLAFLKNELGFDGVFNYKTQDKRAALTELAPQGLDIYYDLVGDDTVEVALDLLNPYGRVLAVGILSFHQNEEPHAPKNLINILLKQLRYEGYVVFDRYGDVNKFWEEMTPLVAAGEIKYKETVIEGGVESIAESYVQMLSGKFTGKVNVQVAQV